MTTRHAACSCGQLHLTIEGEPSRISMCSCLACQRRTGRCDQQPGALPPRTGHLRRKGYDVGADSRKRPCADLSFLSDVRLHRLLGDEAFLEPSWLPYATLPTRISPADHRGVGGVTPPLGLLAARHAAQRHSAGFTGCRSAFVRFGSKADMCNANAYVRFTPKADMCSALACPLCANSGHQPHICSNENRKTASQRSLRKFHRAY